MTLTGKRLPFGSRETSTPDDSNMVNPTVFDVHGFGSL